MKSKVEDAVNCFSEGFNCSQSILSAYCEEFGMDKKTALKIACGLGAGMGSLQETCGAVTGAYMLFGLMHGKFMKEDKESKEKTYSMVREFAARFIERNGTTKCREILGFNLLTEDKQKAKERFSEICPKIVRSAAEIIEDMMFSTKTF